MEKKEYPVKYKDKLGRTVYVLENEFERIVFVYYGNTDKKKIKYHYINQDVYVDAFSRSGVIIFSTVSRNVHETHVEKKYDGTLDFIVNAEKLKLINELK
jgi:hypothetical protein